ncbi:M1-specific T cell receptor beta chain-like isoform X1 [Pempheris klunzingeri]|uniref:M1-specific T cell receptor beta chain-like isoform X1 n=1 Tax=Pempheris klunzingeri TaxID=3127111 RepID=UPI0039812B90
MKPSPFIVFWISVFWIKGVFLNKEKQVFQSPAELLIEPKDETKLTLTHQIQSYDTILWYQRSPGNTSLKLIGYVSYKAVTVESPFQSHFNVSGDGEKAAFLHILSPRHPEDSGEYFGAASMHSSYPAYFGEGTRLTVLEPEHPITEPTVKVLPPSQKECRNQKDNEKRKTLVCVASEFYPDHVSVSWQIGEKEVTDGVATDSAALRNGKYYSITSRLRVSAEVWYEPSNKFICTVSFFINETTKKNSSAFIHGEKAKDTNAMTREKYLRITQSAKLTYSVFIVKSSIYGAFVAFLVWKLQGSSGKQNY